MLRFFLISSIFLCTLSSISQVDYGEFVKQYPLTCTKWDSASVVEAQSLLDSLNQFEIVNGQDQFLHHIGMTYYMRYAKWKNQEDLKKSLSYYQKGFEMYKGSRFAWECCHLNGLIGECDRAYEYGDIYEKLCKEEGVEARYQQLYYILRRCHN